MWRLRVVEDIVSVILDSIYRIANIVRVNRE